MIRDTGRIVDTPIEQKDAMKQNLKWLEVFPKTPKEIAWYQTIDKDFTSAATTEPHVGQSPLLVELTEARRLGLV